MAHLRRLVARVQWGTHELSAHALGERWRARPCAGTLWGARRGSGRDASSNPEIDDQEVTRREEVLIKGMNIRYSVALALLAQLDSARSKHESAASAVPGERVPTLPTLQSIAAAADATPRLR